MIKTRFAPSPTGLLHLGNLYVAFISWLHARRNNGVFIVRIDDTDKNRSRGSFDRHILEDLRWVGLDWDQCLYQSGRLQTYRISVQELVRSQRIYPCYETEEELIIKKNELIKRGLPPIYDRASLRLSINEKEKLKSIGVKPYWRFKLKEKLISWKDQVRGIITFDSRKLNDPVVIRSNGILTYNLASVIDDIHCNVTDIIRGEDHISNSAIHMQIFEALYAKIPRFTHISLIKNNNIKFSKRSASGSMYNLKQNNILPATVLNYFFKKAFSYPLSILYNRKSFIQQFSLKNITRAPILYEEKELLVLNKKIFQIMTFKRIAQFLMLNNKNVITENFWLCMKNNLQVLQEVSGWWDICNKNVITKVNNLVLCNVALMTMPSGQLDVFLSNKWLENIKKYICNKKQKFFSALRLVITGRKNGPELTNILPHINKSLLYERLSNQKINNNQ